MRNPPDLPALLEGVVGGVTIAVLLGLAGWVRARYREREQSLPIHTMLRNSYQRMLNVTDMRDGPRHVSADMVRLLMFQDLLRQIECALASRSSHLHYDKTFDIRSVLVSVTAFLKVLETADPQSPKHPKGMQFYEQHFFEKLDALKWLGMARNDAP